MPRFSCSAGHVLTLAGTSGLAEVTSFLSDLVSSVERICGTDSEPVDRNQE